MKPAKRKAGFRMATYLVVAAPKHLLTKEEKMRREELIGRVSRVDNCCSIFCIGNAAPLQNACVPEDTWCELFAYHS